MRQQHMPREWFITQLWRRAAGKGQVAQVPSTFPSLRRLKVTEWSSRFERLMKNRLIIGAMRYGLLHECSKPRYDRIGDIVKRCALYLETGNDEYLADIANAALLEFEEGKHPLKHLSVMDSGAVWHTRED